MLVLVSHSLHVHLKKDTFGFFYSLENPGLAKAENVLSQNHMQLHQKPEKVSHPGQIAVGSFKSTDIFDLSIVFTEGLSVQRALIRCVSLLSLMSRPEGCVGLAQAHCFQSRSDLCPAQVLSRVSSFGSGHFPVLRHPPVMDQQKHQLPSKTFFGVEVTIAVYAGTIKYGTCCLTMGSSTEFSLLRVQAPSPR